MTDCYMIVSSTLDQVLKYAGASSYDAGWDFLPGGILARGILGRMQNIMEETSYEFRAKPFISTKNEK